MKANLAKLRAEYGKLQQQLAATGWLTHGYVQDRLDAVLKWLFFRRSEKFVFFPP